MEKNLGSVKSCHEISLAGDEEKFLTLRKEAIQSALARFLVRRKAKRIEDLVALYQTPDVSKPRYVRVNTLKMDVQKDDMVPDLLILPPGCDLHAHFPWSQMEGKASMVAVALAPEPGWKLDPKDPAYSESVPYKQIIAGPCYLLDPSCSGSGTASNRLDHLLPSHTAVPAVERVVYSTCSIDQIENEDVVQSLLPLAISYGFQLATPFPKWLRRGLPLFDGSEHLLRTDVVEDKEGFFIALFVRKDMVNSFPSISSQFPQETSALVNTRVDWKETPEAHVFKADLPGLKSGAVAIFRGDSGCRRIRRWIGFKALMENGVLTVTVPNKKRRNLMSRLLKSLVESLFFLQVFDVIWGWISDEFE
ncbi:hypothetical protein EZV62_013196 [Acer yangbiense]|uniref:SAM-dependent MTase RsmB/NOP-type domain-containing protein n=1 Tax=Acer yangbiense TaxID=1000413 RepID=A0A5C7HXH0_9ROSI|nr:hypothetical protein EZV62_013196 [Acer yangbiense]